jgi:hypothetical protein
MRRLIVASVLVLAGCSAAGFDVAHVRESWTEACATSPFAGSVFCEQMSIDDMSGGGTALTVPTTLSPDPRGKLAAERLCDFLAHVRSDKDGKPFGYESVVVVDQAGSQLASCPIA